MTKEQYKKIKKQSEFLSELRILLWDKFLSSEVKKIVPYDKSPLEHFEEVKKLQRKPILEFEVPKDVKFREQMGLAKDCGRRLSLSMDEFENAQSEVDSMVFDYEKKHHLIVSSSPKVAFK